MSFTPNTEATQLLVRARRLSTPERALALMVLLGSIQDLDVGAVRGTVSATLLNHIDRALDFVEHEEPAAPRPRARRSK